MVRRLTKRKTRRIKRTKKGGAAADRYFHVGKMKKSKSRRSKSRRSKSRRSKSRRSSRRSSSRRSRILPEDKDVNDYINCIESYKGNVAKMIDCALILAKRTQNNK